MYNFLFTFSIDFKVQFFQRITYNTYFKVEMINKGKKRKRGKEFTI